MVDVRDSPFRVVIIVSLFPKFVLHACCVPVVGNKQQRTLSSHSLALRYLERSHAVINWSQQKTTTGVCSLPGCVMGNGSIVEGVVETPCRGAI